MAIKDSGTLSLTEIAQEYTDAAPHSISEFYGAPGLPSSGPVSFSSFYNKSDLYPVITSRTTTFNTSNVTSRTTSNVTSNTTFFTTTFFTCSSIDPENNECTAGRNTSRTTSRVTSFTTSYATSFVTTFATSRITSFETLYSWGAMRGL